jgi:membrane associated rhomboid family serine protease
VVTRTKEPIFNVPAVVVATLAVLALVHLGRELLSPSQDFRFLLLFAFIPVRYEPSVLGAVLPGGVGADIWSFLTYALIHGNWMHLAVNAVWLLPFGTAVARRFGTLRFLLFFAVTAVAAAAMHLATHVGEMLPMVGASGSISGLMAGAVRFVFHRGGPLSLWREQSDAAYRNPASPLGVALRDVRVLAFVGTWFGLNILLGLGSLPIAGEQDVAWQAHIGGFLAGLFLFPLFDPIPRGYAGPGGGETESGSIVPDAGTADPDATRH